MKEILITRKLFIGNTHKVQMDKRKPINTPIECGNKMSKQDEGEKVDPTIFKSLVGSLCCLTYARSDSFCWSWSCKPFHRVTYYNISEGSKKDSFYVKGTVNCSLFYPPVSNLNLIGYSDCVETQMIESH